MSDKNKKVYVFIDSGNLWNIYKAKKALLDFRKLKRYISKQYEPSSLKIFYYTAYPKNGTRTDNARPTHAFFTFLSKGLGFNVVKKPLKQIHAIADNKNQYVIEKGNMDVELAIDFVHHVGEYDIALLFSGDSDFLPLIKYARNKGKKTFIFSSKNSVSTELKTGGEGYIDVLEIDEIWGNALKHKNNPR